MSGPSVKIPVDWLDGDHLEDLGADVVMLMITALGHSARQTTNGLVQRRRLRKLWPVEDVEKAIELLVDAGELEDLGDDVQFTRWRDFLLEADEVDRIKALNRERTDRSRRHQKGDHSKCRPEYCREAARLRDMSRETSRDGGGTLRVSDGDPTRPDPTRPLGRGGREGAATGSAGAPPDAGHGLAPFPHDYEYQPHDPAAAEEEFTELACANCGLGYFAMVHAAHAFTPTAGAETFCDECGERQTNPVHHYPDSIAR